MAVPFVTYTLDKAYELRFTMSMAIEFKSITGINISDMQEDPTLEQYMLMLWLMLRRTEKGITQEQVAEIVDEYAESIGDVVDHVSAAYVAGTTGMVMSAEAFKSMKEELASVPNARPTARKKK